MSNVSKYKLEIDLSDNVADRLLKLTGAHGMTISELVNNLLNDLVDGEQSNGSDERDLAERWFLRCSFGMFPDETFLRFLIKNRFDDVFFDAWDRKKSRSADEDRYKEELETGIMRSMDGYEFTWQDLYCNDKESGSRIPAYASKEEWELEVRQEMQDELDEIESCKETIHEYWDAYCAERKEYYAPGTFDEEVQKVLEWRETCHKFYDNEIEESEE